LIQKRKSVDPKSLISLKILPENRIVKASQGTTILEALQTSRIKLDSSCGGMGTCGTCRVFVEQGIEKLGPLTEAELEMSQDRQFESNERLSCQCQAQDGIVLRRP
jgi:ferredoxin